MTEPFSIEEAILQGDDCPKYTARDMQQAVAAERELVKAVVEQCRAALAEELAAWDIDPPLHHVFAAHAACAAWLAETNHNPTNASPV